MERAIIKKFLEKTYKICKEDAIDHSFSLEPLYFNRSISAGLLRIPKYKREE
jgi:hypothetical protein